MLARSLRFALVIEATFYALFAHYCLGASAGGIVMGMVAGVLGLRAVLITLTFACAWMWRSPAPRLTAGRALLLPIMEYLVFVICFTFVFPFEHLWMPRDRLTPASGVVRNAKTPVLLIHGYGCSRAAWWWLSGRLRRNGHLVATISLEPVFTSIDDYVAALARRIDEVLAATASGRVILVGHSMGGLVASAYLQRCGGERVAKLVTLGTPFGGSRLALFGRGENGRQMRVGSAWLLKLANPAQFLPHRLIYSPHDNFVLPQGNLLLTGAKTLVIDGIGHLTMLCSPRVAAAIETELTEGDPLVGGNGVD